MPRQASELSSGIAKQLKTAEKLCSQRGRRLTPIRRKVLEILLRRQRSVKAYELLEEIREFQPGAAPPTVYRALDFLIEEGLIHRLDAVNAWAACMDAAGDPHDILVICTQCGAVAEFSDPELHKKLARKVASAGFVLEHHETELRALCNRCHQQRHSSGQHETPLA
ncbi:Fur family transcriptional regulator [Neopusillimonas maritima]|jgi:Fur family zinc uptake transcriptional regulator|uniref:Transcriptional repressor n=1 Tax=Neopusillimonas maritima TaxID=2026239 RepID=A0A3A1YVP1_9BURK|nr:Fur family transcriptional regulator [Neopusillimonas maritima]MAK54777.1 transcriptional repressor [Pusillimonas sp.]RII82338.1 transcriptional repressor [Neopusillimonas maritima]RIY42323.1 transcriptional repressor [Neopusillimonas maritima]